MQTQVLVSVLVSVLVLVRELRVWAGLLETLDHLRALVPRLPNLHQAVMHVEWRLGEAALEGCLPRRQVTWWLACLRRRRGQDRCAIVSWIWEATGCRGTWELEQQQSFVGVWNQVEECGKEHPRHHHGRHRHPRRRTR